MHQRKTRLGRGSRHQRKTTFGEGFAAPGRSGVGTLLALVLGLAASCGGQEETLEDPGQGKGSAPVPADAILPEDAQAVSFLGDTLVPPALPEDVRLRRQEQLDEALAGLEADPDDADALIWAGRRYAYLGDYRKAIELFTRGIQEHPGDPRFYRHRGHRWITVREPERAITDFQAAVNLIEGTPDEVEPDGQPNPQGIPTSTLHFNIFYHYGLAHFVKGEFEEAEPVYRRCMEVSLHPDSKVATAHWLYMTLRRLGKAEEARRLALGWPLDEWGEGIIESGTYLRLLEIYARSARGEELSFETTDPASLEGATFGYGIGNFHLYNGAPEEARRLFRGIVAARDQWASFGYIAAEADLARLKGS